MQNSIELQNAIQNAINARNAFNDRLGMSCTTYRMDRSMRMVKIEPVGLEIGARVFGELGLGFSESGVFYVYSLPDERGTQILVEDGGRNRFSTWDIFTNDRPISDQFGIGMYYDDDEPGAVKTTEELARLYHRCEVQKRWNDRKEENDRKAYAAEVENLKKKYSGILTPTADIRDWKERAKTEKANLLALLRHEFPSVRFSAKMAGNYSKHIKWNDGPSVEQVKSVVSHFIIHGQTRMDDYYETFPTAFTNTFGGWSDWFEYDRTYSGDYMERLSAELVEAINHETEHWSGVTKATAEYIPSDCAGALVEAIKSNADRWHLALSEDFDGHVFQRRLWNAYNNRLALSEVAADVAELADLRPAESSPVSTSEPVETTTETTDGAPADLDLVEIPGGVAVVGRTHYATYRHRKEIKAHGAKWNKEATQWQATDQEGIQSLRKWFQLAA